MSKGCLQPEKTGFIAGLFNYGRSASNYLYERYVSIDTPTGISIVILRSILFIILLTLVAQAVAAQKYLTQQYTVQDGLSHDNVYRIFQDKRGFLWFGTDYGLSRYNGQVFNSSFTDKEGLLNSAIVSVYENADGKMYVNSYRNGLLQVRGRKVDRYPLNKSIYPAFSVKAMPEHNNIWVISKPHLYKIENHDIKRYPIKNKDGRDVVFYNIVEEENNLLLCSSNGLYSIQHSVPEPYLPHLIKDTVADVSVVKGTFWIGCKRKIVRVDSGRSVKEFTLAGNQVVKDILADSHGNLWIALDGEGMLLLKNGVLYNITSALPINKTIVNDMLEDNEGNIWLATYGAGIIKINSLSVVSYQPAGNDPNIYCRALSPYGKDQILIGSVGKISLWDKGVIKPFVLKTLRADQYVYFIKVIDGKMYVGTSQGLIIKKIGGNDEKILKNDTFSAAISMYRTAKGAVLIGDYTSLLQLENDKLFTLGNRQLPDRYNVIYGTRSGSILYGTDKGIMVSDNEHSVPRILLQQNGRVNDMLEDDHGRIWAATDNGLLCYEYNSWRTLTTDSGLASNKCNKLLEHGDKLWVGTLTGLNVIDLDTVRVHKYTKAVTRDDILSLYCDSNNVLFAGTVNRLISIDLNSVEETNTQPPVYITYARTLRQQHEWPDTLHLSYKENNLVIGFIAINYQVAGHLEFRYKISGLYENWHITKNTSVELSALPSGDHVFILNGRKNGGPWSADRTLYIHVSTPFWKTWWFISIAGVCVVLLVFVVVRYRIVKRHEHLLLYNKIVYLKQQALSALINPHFIFNCMNSIQYYLDNNENDKANTYLADFAHLIRMTLEDAQRVYISLEKEIERIKLYLSLEQLRFGEEFEYDIDVERTIVPGSVFIPNMILQPYIENAIWHGLMPKKGRGKIQASFAPLERGEMKITITDNGVGLHSKANSDTGENGHYGMALTEERLRLLQQISRENYRVEASATRSEEGEVTGTQITIIVTTRSSDISLDKLVE